MGPWELIGWIVAIFLIIALAPTVIELLWRIFVTLPVAIVKDFRAQRLHRRANAGKVRCQHSDVLTGSCKAKATRRTPSGYYCNDHWNTHSKGGVVSFAFLLDYLKDTK